MVIKLVDVFSIGQREHSVVQLLMSAVLVRVKLTNASRVTHEACAVYTKKVGMDWINFSVLNGL